MDQAYHRSLKLSRPPIGGVAPPRPSQVPAPAISLPGRKEAATVHLPDTLRNLLLEFNTNELSFQPEDIKLGAPLDRLPDELVVSILGKFAADKDVTSIERFALVCRKARIVSLDDAIWRFA